MPDLLNPWGCRDAHIQFMKKRKRSTRKQKALIVNQLNHGANDLNELLADGWRVVVVSPFSSSGTAVPGCLVIVQKGR